MKTQIKRTIVAQFYSPLSVRPLSVYCYLVRVFCFTSSSTTLFILHVISECWCGGHLLGGWSYVVVESGDNSSPQWKKHSPWVRVSLFCSMNSGMGSTQHKSGQEFWDKRTACLDNEIFLIVKSICANTFWKDCYLYDRSQLFCHLKKGIVYLVRNVQMGICWVYWIPNGPLLYHNNVSVI